MSEQLAILGVVVFLCSLAGSLAGFKLASPRVISNTTSPLQEKVIQFKRAATSLMENHVKAEMGQVDFNQAMSEWMYGPREGEK